MTRTFPGDLLCVRAGALPHPDNKLSGLPKISLRQFADANSAHMLE